MSLIALGALLVLVAGYVLYGRLVARWEGLDDARTTPAIAQQDGVDYIPTKRFYLFGQHFSAIAAAGPIAGPIIACQLFGWAPCLVWILVGGIFIGAVHDFSALVASVRHRGQSIAEVVRQTVGPRASTALLLFIWVALVYVIVAFADITATTFVGTTSDIDLAGAAFNPGGAVAFGSVVYLALAVVMGLVQARLKPPLWLLTILFVPATLGAVWLGTKVSTLLVHDARTWAACILIYCLIAALLPAWVLLQPRGYLGGFVLYIALAVGILGIFFAGAPIEQAAFKTFHAPGATGALFPFLFVTIACGACSGFHGLVCSGTTSKQVARESDCRSVGYGAMLMESFVAVIALGTVMVVADAAIANRSPGRIYGDGLGAFAAAIVGDQHARFAATFGAMAFSTFVFDTIDVSTRLGRLIVQELLGWKGRAGALAATAATLAPPALVLIAFRSAPGQTAPYMKFWTLFGTANQLLAGLTLLGIAAWLRREKRRSLFVVVPMVFVLAITSWSLVSQIIGEKDLLIRTTAAALLGLAVLMAVETARAIFRERAGGQRATVA